VLEALGFSPGYESGDGGSFLDRVLWLRPPDEVDLHHTLQGVGADRGRLWSVLSGMTELQDVGGQEVEILLEPGRALHVALHAAQHGRDWKVPMEDLRRAIDILPLDTWQEAARLAEQLDATAAFVTGLRLWPEGELVAQRVGLESKASVETLLRAQSPPHLTLGFEKLRTLEGRGAKARFVARKLIPPPANMRFMTPLARKGPLGLAAAYLVRLGWLVRHAGGGFRAWARARREVDGPINGIASLRAGWWTLLAIERTRRQLSRGGLDAMRLKRPPKLPAEAEKGVRVALRYRKHTCLVGAAVRQEWFASQGSHRDIVIGVTAPKDDFQAHAWLEGDPPCHSEGFQELLRHPTLR
jgi:hypothetical protein